MAEYIPKEILGYKFLTSEPLDMPSGLNPSIDRLTNDIRIDRFKGNYAENLNCDKSDILVIEREDQMIDIYMKKEDFDITEIREFD